AEILLPESLLHGPEGALVAALRRASRAPLVRGPEWTFAAANAPTTLKQQLGVASLEGFGLAESQTCVRAAGAVLAYAKDTQRGAPPAVSGLRVHDPTRTAALDRATRATLELLATQRDGRREGSLLSVLDRTCTAMGARLLRDVRARPPP